MISLAVGTLWLSLIRTLGAQIYIVSTRDLAVPGWRCRLPSGGADGSRSSVCRENFVGGVGIYPDRLLPGLRRFLAGGVIQDALAESQALRRDLHEFVGGDVFDRAFQGKF